MKIRISWSIILKHKSQSIMRIIKPLTWSYSSEVCLVEIEWKNRVYKKTDASEVFAERHFHTTLKKQKVSSLVINEDVQIKDNEIILQYIEWSKVLEWVTDKRYYNKVWALLKEVHWISRDQTAIYSSWRLKNISHADFIRNTLEYWKQRGIKKDFDLTPQQINIIERICWRLSMHDIWKASLIHWDLHHNNILIQWDEVYFFDSTSFLMYWTPYWDLSLIAMSYPNTIYTDLKDEEFKNDSTQLSWIIDSYWYDFMNTNRELLDRYVLLRCFTRYPNHFEPHLKQIIKLLINKYS